MSATIYLVRHGRTALNAQGRFRGRQDPPLDDQGYLDAAAAARALMGTGIEAVYASPLRRTMQTAEFVARAANARVHPEQDLIDLDHGRWEGLTAEEATAVDADAFRVFREDPRDARAPEGERLQDVEGRVLGALRRIGEAHEGASVAAVSHEIPIRLAIAAVSGLEGPAMWGIELPTGGAYELDLTDGTPSLVGPLRRPRG